MLCADEMPLVRRAAAHKMQDFVSVCVKQVGCCRCWERRPHQEWHRVKMIMVECGMVLETVGFGIQSMNGDTGI